jgi:hypothetical protein
MLEEREISEEGSTEGISGPLVAVLTVRYSRTDVIAQAVSCEVPVTPRYEEFGNMHFISFSSLQKYQSEELGFICEIMRKL